VVVSETVELNSDAPDFVGYAPYGNVLDAKYTGGWLT